MLCCCEHSKEPASKKWACCSSIARSLSSSVKPSRDGSSCAAPQRRLGSAPDNTSTALPFARASPSRGPQKLVLFPVNHAHHTSPLQKKDCTPPRAWCELWNSPGTARLPVGGTWQGVPASCALEAATVDTMVARREPAKLYLHARSSLLVSSFHGGTVVMQNSHSSHGCPHTYHVAPPWDVYSTLAYTVAVCA